MGSNGGSDAVDEHFSVEFGESGLDFFRHLFSVLLAGGHESATEIAMFQEHGT